MPYIVIEEERCKGCGLCTVSCSRKLVRLSDLPNSFGYKIARFSNPEQCTGCCFCAEVCPDVAIAVFIEEKKP